MNAKRIGSVVAALALMGGLAACSGEDSKSGDSGASADGSAAAADGGVAGFEPGERLTMIVPMSAGGGSDASGRSIAAGLEPLTGATFTTENREGGGGAVGFSYFKGLEGDGSVLIAAETAMVALPLIEDVEFHWTDFTPILKVGVDSTLVIVAGNSPIESCSGLVDAAKAGTVKAAVSGGVTGNDAIQLNLIQADQGVEFQQVPYESGGEVIAALMGGHVDVGLGNPSEIMGQIESGDIKALCVISDERYTYPELADYPTAKEEGIDVTFAQFRSIMAPGGLSEEDEARWIAAAEAYVESDAYKQSMEENYMQASPQTGDDFRAYLEQYEADLKTGLGL